MPSSNSTVDADTLDFPLAHDNNRVELTGDFKQNEANTQNLSSTENVLTSAEALELRGLEATVERGLRTFWEIGQALHQIRDKRLYRQDYPTFEDYCMNRWEMSRRSAYQLIDAALVYENVRHGAQILPANERQVRPLAPLSKQQQQQAWATVVSTAPNGKVTSVHVAQVAREYKRSGVSATPNSKNTHQSQQKQLNENSCDSVTRSCWNCSHCSRELLDDPQSFYCYQFGKLSFIEKDGNQRGAECELWTYRWAKPAQDNKKKFPTQETFTITLNLPTYLQPMIQDAAKEEGLVLVEWAAKVLAEAISKSNATPSTQDNEGFIEVSISEIPAVEVTGDTEVADISYQTATACRNSERKFITYSN